MLLGDKVQILAGQTGVTGGVMLDSDKCQVRLVVKGNISIFAGRRKDNKVTRRKFFQNVSKKFLSVFLCFHEVCTVCALIAKILQRFCNLSTDCQHQIKFNLSTSQEPSKCLFMFKSKCNLKNLSFTKLYFYTERS